MEEQKNVKVLEKALTILDTVKQANEPLGVNELAKMCEINVTTAFRILKTLQNKGWVYQNNHEKYLAGHKLSFATEKSSFYCALKEVAYYVMSALSAREGQAMNLVVRENEKCFILQQSRTKKLVDYVPPIGTYLPIYASACGKILLSELPDFMLDNILEKTEMKPLTHKTIINKEQLMKTLRQIQETGYAIDEHETQEAGLCIAVPVRSNSSEIIAALSFSGFIGQAAPEKIDYYCSLLKKASEEITQGVFLFQTK